MTTALDELRNVVKTLICGLVDDEDAVVVEVIPETMHTNLKVVVAASDFGKVVGRGGQNAQALRFLVKAIGHKYGLPSCMVHIEDPDPDRQGRGSPRRQTNNGWKDRDRG